MEGRSQYIIFNDVLVLPTRVIIHLQQWIELEAQCKGAHRTVIALWQLMQAAMWREGEKPSVGKFRFHSSRLVTVCTERQGLFLLFQYFEGMQEISSCYGVNLFNMWKYRFFFCVTWICCGYISLAQFKLLYLGLESVSYFKTFLLLQLLFLCLRLFIQ